MVLNKIVSVSEQIRSTANERGWGYVLRGGIRKVVNSFFERIVWKLLPKSGVFYTISRSRLLTSLYFLFQGTFLREQRAILAGIGKYHKYEENQASPKHRLIRGTHRLEKGLSMPTEKKRDVFAEGYIMDVVEDLQIAWESNPGDRQLYWTIDVLNEYFETVESTEHILRAETAFENFLSIIEYTPETRVPFPRRQLDSSPVSYEDMLELAKQRTSTRWFEQRDVPRKHIDDSLEIAIQSPSACNRQSYEFRIFDNPDLIDEVSSLAIGASGYKDNIPCLAVIVGKQRAYFDVRDKHVIYIDASLAAMAFQFSLETRGLASCCINWPTIPRNEKLIADLLDIEDDEEVIMLMAIGYPDPDGMIPYSEKKPVETIRSYNDISQ